MQSVNKQTIEADQTVQNITRLITVDNLVECSHKDSIIKKFYPTSCNRYSDAANRDALVERLKKIYHIKADGSIGFNYDHNKNPNAKPRDANEATGFNLHMNHTELICIDFDVNHDLSDEMKQAIRDSILYNCYKCLIQVDDNYPYKLMYDVSCNGGMHIWVLNDVNDWIQQQETDSSTKLQNIFTLDPTNDIEEAVSSLDVDLFIPLVRTDGKCSRGINIAGTIININTEENQEPIYKSYTISNAAIRASQDPLTYTQFVNACSSFICLPKDLEEFSYIFGANRKSSKAKLSAGSKRKTSNSNDSDEITPEDAIENITDSTVLTQEILDVIVNGFNKDIVIHSDGGDRKLENEVNCFIIATALLAGVSDDPNSITIDDAEDAYYDICSNATLTDSAKANYRNDWRRYKRENTKASTWKGLVKALDTYNHDYYVEHLESLMRTLKKQQIPFEEDTYTYNNFERDASRCKTLAQVYKLLARCVAIHDGHGFIVRRHNNGNTHYELFTRSSFKKDISFAITVEATEADIEKMRAQKKKIKDAIETSTFKILESPTFKNDYAKHYNDIALLSNDPEVLCKCIPPTATAYKKELIEEFISFYSSLVVHPEPFMELINSVASRLQHPEQFIEKFFINYGVGHDGKSLLTYLLSLVFPKHTNVAVQQEQIESDRFNAWIVDSLMIWLEEAQTANYQTKNIDQRVKQLTTHKLSTRGMHKETTEAYNWSIVGMNTNSKDLYGLIRADNATLERLVIIEFKQDNDRNAIDAMAKKFTSDPCFSYSLWNYLKNDYQIPSTFTTVRYHGSEKYQFIENAKVSVSNSVLDWFIDQHDNVFTKTTIKKQACYVARERVVNQSYDYYKKSHPQQKCIQKPKETLMQYGFDTKTTSITTNGSVERGVRLYYINEEAYNALLQKLIPADDEDDEPIELNDGESIVF